VNAFKEWLESLAGILPWYRSLPHGRSAPLAVEPGPPLLPWDRAGFAPRAGTEEASGTIYGRPFQVTFGRRTPPRNHGWGLATWHPDQSGTGQAEVRAVCRTCSDMHGWPVSTLACRNAADLVAEVYDMFPDLDGEGGR